MLLLSCGDGLRFSVAICRRRFAIACLLPLFALLPQSAQAANRTWGNTGTNFNTGTSWSGGTAPGSNDVAVFNSAAITQPNLSGSLTIQELNFTTTSSSRSEEHTSELQSQSNLVCRLLLEKKKYTQT